MTGLRVRTFLFAAAAVLVLPAAAQWVDSKPPVLGPGDYPPEATEEQPPSAQTQTGQGEATGAPKPLSGHLDPETEAPAGNLPDYPPPPADSPASGNILSRPGVVEVDALGKPEGPPAGTLNNTNGGLGDHLWSGSDRAKAEELLARAPIVSGDPVLRNLVRRAVLTKAAAPPGQAKKAFVTLRIERLLNAGLVEEAGALAAEATVPNDAEFARVQADAVLLANRAGDACGPATATRLESGGKFWLQLRAYCAAVNGDTATAELTKAVLKAQGYDDPAYDSLVEGILSKTPLPPGAISEPTALHIFLLQQAGLPVPVAISRRMGTAENLLTMRDLRNPPRARFEAAERVASTGAATPAELIKIANAQDLPASRMATAASDAPGLPFFMGQVLLRRAAAVETRPEAKAKLAALALALGEKYKMVPLAAALQADIILQIKPSPDLAAYGRRFAQALILAKRPDLASRWAMGDQYVKLAAAVAAGDPASIASIQTGLASIAAGIFADPQPPDAGRDTSALVLGLADVLGVTMPAETRAIAASVQSQMWAGKRPGPGTMRTIHEIAGLPERRGEAVLLLADTIYGIGLKDLAPDATIAFVRLLIQMNQLATARALAIEALAQYVPPPVPLPAGTR